MIDREKVIEELEICLTASCRGKSGYCPIPDQIWHNLDEVLELLKEQSNIIEKYHKADSFLNAHGWRWTDDRL